MIGAHVHLARVRLARVRRARDTLLPCTARTIHGDLTPITPFPLG